MTPGVAPLIGVIDDDEDIPLALSSLLRSLGYRSECFASCAALLSCPSLGDFACLISDVHMPLISGIELIAKVHAIFPNLPVILMTGRFDATLLERASRAGAASLLSKPFNAEDVDRRLAEVMAPRS